MQIDAVAQLLRQHGVDLHVYPAAGIVMIAAALARGVVAESALGISVGHAEALMIVEGIMRQFSVGSDA
jgi:hypothetical protein